MAGEPQVTFIGTVVADPDARVSQAGKPWTTFRIACTPRVQNRETNDWEDGETMWVGCRIYGVPAENVAATLYKGMRVIVQGRLSQRAYTDNQGQQRTSLDLEVEEVGPSLRFATAAVSRAGSGPAGGGYAKTGNGQQPQYGQTDGGGLTQPGGQQSFGDFDSERPF